jgi:hypothetical protein
MFGLNRLWSSLSGLTDAIFGLADTVRQIDTGLRSQARLDGHDAHAALEGPVGRQEELGHTADEPNGSDGNRRTRSRAKR